MDLTDDVTLIQSQLDRYSRRMNFWVERHLELEDLVVDAHSRTITYHDNSITLHHARISAGGRADEPA